MHDQFVLMFAEYRPLETNIWKVTSLLFFKSLYWKIKQKSSAYKQKFPWAKKKPLWHPLKVLVKLRKFMSVHIVKYRSDKYDLKHWTASARNQYCYLKILWWCNVPKTFRRSIEIITVSKPLWKSRQKQPPEVFCKKRCS